MCSPLSQLVRTARGLLRSLILSFHFKHRLMITTSLLECIVEDCHKAMALKNFGVLLSTFGACGLNVVSVVLRANKRSGARTSF